MGLKEKVDAKNDLESYSYSLKNQLGDKEKLGGKISDEDKEKLEGAIDEAIKFLDDNPDAEPSEYKDAKKTLEDTATPIITKLYQGQAPPPGADTGSEDDEDAGSEKDEL